MKRICKQYADPQFLSPDLQKDERSLLEGKALEDYEIVSPRVPNQTSPNTSLLPVSSASISQISNLNGSNQQSSSRSMSELMEQSRSFFLGNSQVSLVDNIRKYQSAVEGEVINIGEGDFGSASQTVNAIGISSVKKRKRKISRTIELEDLRPYFGNTRAEAAKSLGVSVSTVKCVCREHRIPRWPHRKINKDEYSPSQLKGTKTGASVQSSLTVPFRGALPSKPLVQEAVQFFQSDAPSFNLPPRKLSAVTVAQTSPPERRIQDANFVTIKATYDGTNTIIKFDLRSSATMDDLEGEVAKRLKLNVGSFTIKYQDQEGDWISITGCDDMQYCIRTLRSLATIRMLVLSLPPAGQLDSE